MLNNVENHLQEESTTRLLSGVLVLTQHLNGKYCVSSRPSDERMGILRHRTNASNVAVVSLLRNKNGGGTTHLKKKKSSFDFSIMKKG
jgi:hypothetical protein